VVSAVFAVVEVMAGLGGFAVASGASGEIGAMQIIRQLGPQEDLNGLVNWMYQESYTSGLEHAVVNMGGSSFLVKGGAAGIELSPEVDQVLLHTHPFPPAGVPSQADFGMLDTLQQESSWILSRDGLTQFFRK
jgi:hypothetical protein